MKIKETKDYYWNIHFYDYFYSMRLYEDYNSIKELCEKWHTQRNQFELYKTRKVGC